MSGDQPTLPAPQRYANLMTLVILRLNEIQRLVSSELDLFSLEAVGSQIRKTIEAISYSALVSCEMETAHVPRQVRGLWNANEILRFLESKNLLTLPKRVEILDGKAENRSLYVVYGKTEDQLEWLTEVYRQVHFFAHEANPYSQWQYYAGLTEEFLFEQKSLAGEIHRALCRWLQQHVIQLKAEWYVVQLGLDDASGAIVKQIPLPDLVELES